MGIGGNGRDGTSIGHTMLRAEITDLERRLVTRLASEEGTIARLLRSVAGQSETGFGAEAAALESRIALQAGYLRSGDLRFGEAGRRERSA